MNYTDNEMCTILLNSYIGMEDDAEYKPLTLGEWNQLIDRLVLNKLEPRIVYSNEVSMLKEIGYEDAFVERLKKLADRGAGAAFELEEYEKKGIGAVTFISKNYPIMLRRQLKNKKPPVLFYSGDISLANKIGIGIVGSRNVSSNGVVFTEKLVEKAVNENIIIYSGGARGVDKTSQAAALNSGGAVTAYISDSLVAAIKKRDILKGISEGKLLLFSDLKPDAGFTVGRAMNRNKYIYASAMGTFVVESDFDKGGTWNGATEAIKNGYGKVFVYNKNVEGNQKLIEKGGIPYEISEKKLMDVISEKPLINQNSSENNQSEKQFRSKKESEQSANYQQITLMDVMKGMNHGKNK